MDKLIKIRTWEEVSGVNVIKVKYYAEITHSGLKEHRVLSASDDDILDNKVQSYIGKLTDKWEKLSSKLALLEEKENNLQEAENRTREAKSELEFVDNILHHTLSIDDTVDWDTLKDFSKFDKPNPETDILRKKSSLINPQFPPEPKKSDFDAKYSFIEKVIPNLKKKKDQLSEQSYLDALNNWKYRYDETSKEVERLNNLKLEIDKEAEKSVADWEIQKKKFHDKQERKNRKVDELKSRYLKGDENAILEYCELVLSRSEYPDQFPQRFELEYNNETKILIVEYSLPNIGQLPTLNEVKYIKNELKEYHISESQRLKLFDATMYKIVLRTIHELFEADAANAIDLISFNGWVEDINKSTGKSENNCILSIQARKTEFMEIDLTYVDPKACFKSLKGVGSSKLSGLTPVQPIIQINKTDKRFTNHYEVAKDLDSSTNLASMDWEDFEHLIREVFANEFNSNGGEVKVTQASKDGGVDAIAFDPDPIRGGKIVIQAKRYTNTVGVAAVRDLFGTVMNEGATKGILVTTADYGPDAYEFAKGKPLTLMNGANLLYLLEKHGHKARIDIKEAKRLQKEG